MKADEDQLSQQVAAHIKRCSSRGEEASYVISHVHCVALQGRSGPALTRHSRHY